MFSSSSSIYEPEAGDDEPDYGDIGASTYQRGQDAGFEVIDPYRMVFTEISLVEGGRSQIEINKMQKRRPETGHYSRVQRLVETVDERLGLFELKLVSLYKNVPMLDPFKQNPLIPAALQNTISY